MKLIEYLPLYLQDYRELKTIFDTDDFEIDAVSEAVTRVLNNEFIKTLDDYGCKRWEKMLNLLPGINDSLDTRRMRILAKFLEDLPYTERSLKNVLNTMLGEDGYKLTIFHNQYHLHIDINGWNYTQEQIILDLLRNMIPANLTIDDAIIYTTHGYLGGIIIPHEELKPYTHKELSKRVLKSKPFTHGISNRGLAGFTHWQIRTIKRG